MRRTFFIISILLFLKAGAQNDSSAKFICHGYVSAMQGSMYNSLNKNWQWNSYLTNRLNFKWYATKHFTAVMEMRNRYLFGDYIKADPVNYAKGYDKDYGLMDLNINLAKGNSYLLNTNIDRLYLAYQQDKLNITLGRQRINWGQTFAWNPNDIFNTYSFFDFDYIERPGSDALRIQYYNTETSVSEIAVKMNYKNQVTAAGLYRFNALEYDIQFLGGIFNSSDYVIGTGFSGNIKSIALRGEATYLHPKTNFTDTSGMFIASIEADYTFGNNLNIQGEYLFNQKPGIDFNRFVTAYNTQLDVKSLSFVKNNFFAQVSYPITPLLNGSLAGMIFPQYNGFYVGPSLTYSIANNIDFSFIMQTFSLEMNNQRIGMVMGFMRLKLNF
jgi:hypothetical protein